MPQNVLRGVCQTSDGYLWLATMDGLVRFDGVRFAVFNQSNTPGIRSNRYTSLYCSVDGDLWAGTEFSGITLYRQGRFTTYTKRDGLPSDFVWSISGDKAGRVWALSNSSIVQWDAVRSRFGPVQETEAQYRYFPINGFAFCSFDADRLHLFDEGRFFEYPLPADWPSWRLTRATKDIDGALWLAGADGRLAKMTDGRWREMRRSGFKYTSREPDKFEFTYRDTRGSIWNFGIAFDPGNLMVQYLSLPSGQAPGRIQFNSFYEDREGSIWLATDGQGLYRVRKPVISTLSISDGLPDRNIYPIYQDRSDAIWIGTWNGGLARFYQGKFTIFREAADKRSFNRITSLAEDRDGALWVGTYSGLFREMSGCFEQIDNELLRLPGTVVRAIQQDKQGTLWFGTGNGLLRYKDGNWNVFTNHDGLAADDVRVIIEGRSDCLWIAGYGGLTKLAHGRFQHWTQRENLTSTSIRALYEDREGVLWMGTYDGGLGRLQNGKLTWYTVRNGLFSNGVFQILEDSRGYLWMTCNRGIYRVSKHELNEFAAGKRRDISSIAYGKSDGMRNEECNGGTSPAGIRARNGELWFPTQDGVAVIDPDHISTNRKPPPVVIESVAIDRQFQPADQALRIPPGKEDLQINYTALSFIDPAKIRFKYQLTGLDRGWVDAYTRRTAYYSHLPPGDYEFRVTAANSDGVWNVSGARLRISVLPPFYRTWWFLTLASLTLASAVLLAWQNRVAQLQRANRIQQAFSRQLIASQENERKRIAAELHDSLGQHLLIINNWALLAIKGLGAANSSKEPLQEISAAAMQAIDEVRGIAYNLRPYQLEKLGLTTAIQDLVSQIAASSTIRFSAEVDRVDNMFDQEVEIGIYRIIQEALNNILRHSEATEARVILTCTAALMKLTVQDNGRGFIPSDGRSPQSNRNGFGLLGIVERARILGGQAIIESTLGVGTTISISLQVKATPG